MSERTTSRLGALAAILSFILSIVGFGLHGGLPSAANADSVRRYVEGANPNQTGVGNYVELLGIVLFLVFATYLYSVARATNPDRLNWFAVAGLSGAVVYVALNAVAIASQQVMVEWAKAGADATTVLGISLLTDNTFTLAFELAALFLAGTGLAFLNAGRQLRVIGLSSIIMAAVVFLSGLIGIISLGNQPISGVGILLFNVWMLIAGIYLLIRPPMPTRVA